MVHFLITNYLLTPICSTKRIDMIVLADDHKLFLDAISDSISVLGHEVKKFRNGKQAIGFIMANLEKIDLIITDINMPEMDGMELVDNIKKTGSDVKILVVSVREDRYAIRQMADKGVHGYLLKNSSKDEFLKAIKVILDGKRYFSPLLKQSFAPSFLDDNDDENGDSMENVLSEREIDVVKLICKEYTTDEIADELHLSVHTINSYRKNILRKINVKNIAGLVRYAMQKGLID